MEISTCAQGYANSAHSSQCTCTPHFFAPCALCLFWFKDILIVTTFTTSTVHHHRRATTTTLLPATYHLKRTPHIGTTSMAVWPLKLHTHKTRSKFVAKIDHSTWHATTTPPYWSTRKPEANSVKCDHEYGRLASKSPRALQGDVAHAGWRSPSDRREV